MKAVNKIVFPQQGEMAWWVHNINDDFIEKWLCNQCPNTVDGMRKKVQWSIADFKDEINENIKTNNIIWTLWWQGEENAPLLVKRCIESMRKYSNGHPVIVLDKDNYKEYVKLPQWIIDINNNQKNDKSCLGKFGLDNTKLSDIIRCKLLYLYGGLWADATIMFTDYIDEYIFTDEFSTLGQDDRWYIGEGRWSTFFMGCKNNNLLMRFIFEFHLEYWQKKKYYVNYLMIDHMIDIAYKMDEKIKSMIDEVRTGNKECVTINRNYNKPIDPDCMADFFKRQKYHKLSWKWWGLNDDVETYTKDGRLTWLGFLLNFVNR